MTAEEYLKRIIKIDAVLLDMDREYNKWLNASKKYGGTSFGGEVRQGGYVGIRNDAVAEYVDLEKKIKELKLERLSIIENIRRLPRAEYEVIYKIYVEGYMVKSLPGIIRRSPSYVGRRKHRGLMLIQRMIDETK